MASTETLELLIDSMGEAWNYFERVQQSIIDKALSLLPDDTEILRAHCADALFKDNLLRIRQAEEHLWNDIDATTPSPPWNTVQEKCWRFLARSNDNLETLISTHKFIAGLLRRLDPSADSLHVHCQGARDMARLLVQQRFPVIDSDSWTCRNGPPCTASDHFHSSDKLVWPKHDAQLEESMPIGASPCLEWRDFRYETIESTEPGWDCLSSAIIAVQMSIQYVQGKDLACVQSVAHDTLRDTQALLEKKKYLQALAMISVELGKLFRTDRTIYDIGIILPGGSRVFYPASPWDANGVYVYIKLTENFSDRNNPFRFQAVKRGEFVCNDNCIQTKCFLDLPPEIRNMIYEQILWGEREAEGGQMPRKQPAISRTCKTVNKEILSLLWLKYGWLVAA